MTLQYAILHYAAKDDPLRDKAFAAFFDFARRVPVGQIYNGWSKKLISLDDFEARMRAADTETP